MGQNTSRQRGAPGDEQRPTSEMTIPTSSSSSSPSSASPQTPVASSSSSRPATGPNIANALPDSQSQSQDEPPANHAEARRTRRKSVLSAFTGGNGRFGKTPSASASASGLSSSGSRPRLDSAPSSVSGSARSLRKRWRMSRRGTKANEGGEQDVRMNGGTEDNIVAGAPVVAADKAQAVDPTATPTPTATGEVSSPPLIPDTVVAAPAPSTSTQSAASPAPVEAAVPPSLSPQPSTTQPEIAATITAPSDTTAPIATPTADTQEPQLQQPQPQPPRAFPPAGTLVVVQGVVHTTDVAPTPINTHPTDTTDSTNTNATTDPSPHRRSSSVPSRSSSIPAGGLNNRSRTRLGSLMPRPMRSRPSSFAASGSGHANVNGSSTSVLDRPDTADSSSRRNVSHLNESSATSEEPETLSPPAAAPVQTTSNEPPRPAALSPTSIDVLGTLIGLATAATAASLVTGSSDPLFHSGLALPGSMGLPHPHQRHGHAHQPSTSSSTAPISPISPIAPNSNSTPAFTPYNPPTPFMSNPPRTSEELQARQEQGQGAAEISPTSRPTSPTPTAGLGGSGAGSLRNTWGNIRNRLGLSDRPSSSSVGAGAGAGGSGFGSLGTGAGAGAGASGAGAGGSGFGSLGAGLGGERPRDARSQLMAEMERALNLGMGLRGPPPGTASSTTGAGTGSSAGAGGEGGPNMTLAGEHPIADHPPLQPYHHHRPHHGHHAHGLGGLGGFGAGEQDHGMQSIEVNLSAMRDANREPPPGDSFERFLWDLQVDLRRTLGDERTQGVEEGGNAGDAATAPADTDVVAPATASDAREDAPSSVQASSSPVDEGGRPGSLTVPGTWPEDAPAQTVPSEDTPTPVCSRPASRAGSLPPLESLSGASSEESEGEGGGVPEVDTSASGLGSAPGAGPSVTPFAASTSAGATPTTGAGAVPPPFVGATPTPFAGSAPTHAAPANPAASRTVSGSERRPNGGINWWRMYRFPPMTIPPGQQPGPNGAVPIPMATAAGIPAGPTPPSPLQVPLSEPVPSATTATPSAPDTNAAAAAAAAAGEPSVVVPVILVSLQSVNSNGRDLPTPGFPGPPPPEDLGDEMPSNEAEGDANDGPGLGGSEEGEGSYYDEPGTRPGTPGAGAIAGSSASNRRWRNRASNALRNLRPARRADPASNGLGTSTNGRTGRTAADGVGSTTFFIYVIGGYYPPNHHLVTGTAPLDSFEALWELAELLGQVKPPTATREDIERSGLEIIRASDLERLEGEGRVANNCVDRCLICLEDYAPEEELRLMSCRHTFHKDCVDKWLETGRNNCPACRSQGVETTSSTETPAEAAPAPSAPPPEPASA